MKTFQVTIISIIALALSGCATGYYQRGYAGYNRGYSSPSYYQSYGRSYYSPGTSFSYGREYVQPSYGYEHREHQQYQDRHHDWQPPAPRFNHQEGGHGGWNGQNERHADWGARQNQPHFGQAPQWSGNAQPHQQQTMPEQHQHEFGGNRGEGGGDRQHQGHHGRHGQSE